MLVKFSIMGGALLASLNNLHFSQKEYLAKECYFLQIHSYCEDNVNSLGLMTLYLPMPETAQHTLYLFFVSYI